MRWMSSGRISPSSETFYWLRPVSSIFPRGNGGRCGFSYSKSIASLMVLLISKYDCWLFVMRVPAGPPNYWIMARIPQYTGSILKFWPRAIHNVLSYSIYCNLKKESFLIESKALEYGFFEVNLSRVINEIILQRISFPFLETSFWNRKNPTG